jgi:hypothetical protein
MGPAFWVQRTHYGPFPKMFKAIIAAKRNGECVNSDAQSIMKFDRGGWTLPRSTVNRFYLR